MLNPANALRMVLRGGAVVAVSALVLHARAAPATQAAEAAIRRAAAAYAELERQHVEKLAAELDRLVADPALVQAFQARDREKLLALARPRFAQLGAERNITHWYFHGADAARTCFLRVHAPTLHGDSIRRETLERAVATGRVGSGKELGRTAFALRVVKPVRQGGALVGYMEVGEEIEHFLGRMKAQTGDDFGVLVDKARIDRQELARVRGEDRWDERPDVVLIESTMWNDRNVELGMPLAKLPSSGAFLREWKDGARTYVGGAFPIRDAADHVVGALFVRHPVAGP